MFRLTLAIGMSCLLFACDTTGGGTQQVSEIEKQNSSQPVEGGHASVSRKEGGVVQGKVGSAWSDEDLKKNAFGVVCGPSGKVTNLQIMRKSDGSAEFSAVCVS